MKIKFFCPIWGMVPDYVDHINGSIKNILERVKEAGYDGIEMCVPFKNEIQKAELSSLLKELDLELVALQGYAFGKTADEYLISYEDHIRSAADVDPLFINSHTGTDYFSFEDMSRILKKAAELATELGIKIVHETHRGKFSFHAGIIQTYLHADPELRLTGDFSHWCSVSESFLQDQKERVNNAIQRVDHIHARVGHTQSAQVSDPRAPEWQEALNYHLEWWDEIIKLHRQRGTDTVTITNEFGPGSSNYMPLLPYTRQPIADQWAINLWMKDFLKKRYAC